MEHIYRPKILFICIPSISFNASCNVAHYVYFISNVACFFASGFNTEC